MLDRQTEYLTLNGCGLGVLGLSNLVHQLFIEAKMSKTGRRLWRSSTRYLKQGKEYRNCGLKWSYIRLISHCMISHPQVQLLS